MYKERNLLKIFRFFFFKQKKKFDDDDEISIGFTILGDNYNSNSPITKKIIQGRRLCVK